MDPQLIQLIARLKIRMRQELGVSLNTQRFFDDRAYAIEALDRAEESEDIDTVVAALELRNRLGWMADPDTQAEPELPAGGRYRFGARGG